MTIIKCLRAVFAKSTGLAGLLWLASLTTSSADQFDTMRLYWRDQLLAQSSSASTVANTANGYWSTMNTNASRTSLWSDLPFGSSSWNIVGTFNRLRDMALAWAKPGSSLQNNTNLAQAVASGLDWMAANVYTPTATEYDNWFHWEDSGPMAFENAAVLLYPALTGQQVTNYCASIDHFNPSGWMTGANLADKVLIMAIRGIVGKNSTKLATAQSNLSAVFPYVTSGDGFYTDGSFVFHTAVAYNGHYGLVLLGDIPVIANLLKGSPWEITDPNLTNVFNWVTDGFEPLIYNGNLMDMVRGRVASWSNQTESEDGATALSVIRQIGNFAPPAVGAAFTNFANSPRLSSGQFHFAAMDRVVAHRAGFSFGLSMSSSRIYNYESINNGNLHGWFTGDGMTYLYVGSGETQFSGDFWPTVEPYFLPGTTVEITALANAVGQHKTTDQNWVGGAQVANTYGVAGMSLHPAAVTTKLYGKKSWFMLDNEIVCLGAGITCGDAAGVHTTAENRRLGSPITASFTLSGKAITPPVGWSSNLPSATPSWCALDGTGGYYIPAGSSNLQATFVANSGAWSQINSGDSGTVHTDNYFRLWYDHGVKPTNATYAYVLLPGMSATSVSNYALAPDIIILTNTPAVQAVQKPALGVTAANFWTNGTSSAGFISVNNPASVIVWETPGNLAVGIADATQTNKNSITVTLNRSGFNLVSADPGVTVVQLAQQIILSVNVNGAAGRSFQAMFGPASTVQSGTLPGLTNDCDVRNDGLVQSESGTTILPGGSGSPVKDRSAVYVFQLPFWGNVANPFTSATLSFNLSSTSGTGLVDTDLYGLGRRASPMVLGTDYYSGTNDAAATLLHVGLLTAVTPLGLIATAGGSGTGTASLMNYLNAQYAGGAGAGQYVFLRFSSETDPVSVSRYNLTTAEGGTVGPPDTRPQIAYTAGAASNTAPVLAAITNRTLVAGQTLTITNLASDADVPSQTLTFNLLAAPMGAGINAENGVLNWRPLIAQSPSTNQFSVRVTDSGSPGLSAIQNFTVAVLRPANPVFGTNGWNNGAFQFTIMGDSGPDYVVQASTNLIFWQSVWTNSAPPPFQFGDPDSTQFNQRFYRVLLGP